LRLLILALICYTRRCLVLFLGFNSLFKDANYIKVFLFKINSFALKVCSDNFFLFLDRAGSTVNFLQKDLHKISLTDDQVRQFLGNVMLVFRFTKL
jgi:hypothetical protein